MRWVTNEGRLCELKCCGDDAEQSGGFGERAVGGFPQGSLLGLYFSLFQQSLLMVLNCSTFI